MSSPDDRVLLNVEDGIAHIRFNRPAALNAIDEALARGFHSACEAVSQRSDVRVVVLSGAGRAFMAGGDVRRMREAGADAAPAGETTRFREEALDRCLEKVAPRSRELLWRRYSGRQDSDEMAAGLGMTAAAVRVALTKARAFLRDCVSAELKNAS